MIDFDNISTIPNSILSLIDEKREAIRGELLLESQMNLAGHKWKGGLVSIENYNESFQKILEILQNEKILAFHCTKQINPSQIYETGLNVFNSSEYEDWMKKFLNIKISDKRIIKKIDKCFKDYKELGEYEHREKMIWFVINKSLVYNPGCKYFFKYFGGEVSRRVLYPIKDVVFPILIQTGIPTVVVFEFEFNELSDYHQNNLVSSFIKSKIFDKSYKYYMEMGTEGYIEKNIKPQEIIQIFYDNDAKKLKNTVANMQYSQKGF